MTDVAGEPVLGERAGRIWLITINNPPVNALGQAVRAGISREIRHAGADPAVAAAVIIGGARTFPAGADIKEFGKPPLEPGLPELCQQIENCAKPVIAALHGTALGGGLEIALAAHYRIADDNARLGLPEVSLGLLPGAGGTQRMPRITGAKLALDVMLSGKPIHARKALESGLLDEIATAELRPAATEYAERLVRTGAGPRPTSERREGFADMAGFDAEIAARRETLLTRAKGQKSPFLIVDCVAASANLPFDDGIKMERAAFIDCLGSEQSKGMIHAFFAERQTAKVPEAARAAPRTVATGAVIGGGTMGAGIAVALLSAGLPVIMIERDDESVARGRENVTRVFEQYLARGRISAENMAETLGRFGASTNYAALGDVDLVIEAVFEDMAVKKTVFQALDRAMKSGAVLATNTSYLDVNALAGSISRPKDVIGLHFFSPANIMKLLEIVVPDKVSDDVVATAFALARRLGKTPVRSRVCDGFIGNRLMATYRRAADYMMEDGASPYEIDAAIRDFGFAMGPYQVSDLAGGDIGWATRKRRAPGRDKRERYVEIGDRICENGWFGQKTGRGYYRYDDGSRIGREDPEVLAIIQAERARAGITPRRIPSGEIQRRYLAAMVNEACNVLAEGIALRPLDIDVTLLAGYGFPRWRGGPMKWADSVGLGAVLANIREYAIDDAFFWRAAPMLQELVLEGREFEDLNQSGRAHRPKE